MKKTLDIGDYCIISTYDVNKMQNSILKISQFHIPASHLPQNRHDTMGDIAKRKLVITDSLHIFGSSFFAHPLPEILTKHNIKETVSKGNI